MHEWLYKFLESRTEEEMWELLRMVVSYALELDERDEFVILVNPDLDLDGLDRSSIGDLLNLTNQPNDNRIGEQILDKRFFNDMAKSFNKRNI